MRSRTAASISAALEPGREHVARDLRQLERLRRVVALVRHPHHLLAEAEREQQLGRVGDEAHDAHALTVRARRPAPGDG